ncbi:glycosyltransferase family 4 protein, partial [bacterium]|nr:glycosyltransferase family 4 protein [bacterium]
SLILAAESYFNRRWFDVVDYLDAIVTPSEFVRAKFTQYGIPAEKTVHHLNCLDMQGYEPRYGGDGYGLFLGRLSGIKGIGTLLDAMKQVPEERLKIAGEGPESDRLCERARSQNMRNVEFTGYLAGRELTETIRNADFVVVPSECFENSPYSIAEAMAFGKPVIASRMGGIPELVEERVSGLLFQAGNSEELARKISEMSGNTALIEGYGREARKRAEILFSPEKHLAFLESLYADLRTR